MKRRILSAALALALCLALLPSTALAAEEGYSLTIRVNDSTDATTDCTVSVTREADELLNAPGTVDGITETDFIVIEVEPAEGKRIKTVYCTNQKGEEDDTDSFIFGGYGGAGMRLYSDSTFNFVIEDIPETLPTVESAAVYSDYEHTTEIESGSTVGLDQWVYAKASLSDGGYVAKHYWEYADSADSDTWEEILFWRAHTAIVLDKTYLYGVDNVEELVGKYLRVRTTGLEGYSTSDEDGFVSAVFLIGPAGSNTPDTPDAPNTPDVPDVPEVPEVPTYTVTFDSDGGSAVAAQTVAEGGKVTKPADPTKVKHAFDGWYDENDSKWNFSTPITEDITLYAKWVEKDYTVNFESEGGSAVAPQYVDGGERLKKPADPTKSGHTFGGWYRDTVFEKVEDNVYTFTVDTENLFNDVYAWSFDTEVVMGDFTLHAKWTQIPYTGGGGGGSSTTPVKPEDKKDEEKKDEEQPVPTVTFSDVPSEAYYADAVAWAVEKGITNGVGEGSFAPEASCTRGQMVTFLWRMAGCPTVSGGASFSDVTTDSYYADAIAWAVSMGITNGTGDGLFSPDAECSRAQMAVFLFRMVGASAAGGSSFGDVDAGAYYAVAVAWAVANGITNGTGDGLFSPNMTCTRGQMVTFLFRCFAE